MHNKLPKKYYFIDNFNKRNIECKDATNTAIIYRNYSKKINEHQIINFKNSCRKKGIKFFIANNIKLAIKLGIDGAYLPSFNTDIRHLNYKLKNNFIIIGSAHNVKEIRLKEFQKVSLIFLSSIFKKNNNYLGINKFRNISKLSKIKIIALGGITKKNIRYLNLTNCYGFAGISYFK